MALTHNRWTILCRTCGEYFEYKRHTPGAAFYHLFDPVARFDSHGNSYIISEQKGKQVQEILNRYINEELKPQLEFDDTDVIQKDIAYIENLAKLFD